MLCCVQSEGVHKMVGATTVLKDKQSMNTEANKQTCTILQGAL